MAGSDLRWSGFECSLFSGSSEVVAGGCIDSSWSHNNRRTCSAIAKMNRTYIKKYIYIHIHCSKMDPWLLMQFHTPERAFQHPETSNSCFYQSVSRQSNPNSPVRWFKENLNSLWWESLYMSTFTTRLYLRTLKLVTVDEPCAHHRPSPPCWTKSNPLKISDCIYIQH